MIELLEPLFLTRFLPAGNGAEWQSNMVRLHAISDAAIFIGCLAIAGLLIGFLRRRQDAPFRLSLWSFCLFVAFCGMTHGMNVVTLWYPLYGLAGGLKALTAVASLGACIALLQMMPSVLRIPSFAQLKANERELASEKARRRVAEEALETANGRMEEKTARGEELARAGAAERQSDKRFQGSFDQAGIGLSHRSAAGKFTEVNQRFCEIAGYSSDELVKMNFSQITHPDDIATDWAQAGQLLTGQTRHYCLEERYIHKDGHEIWVNLAVSLVSSGDFPDYFLSAVQDITARKIADAEILASESKYRELADAMVHIVWTAKPNGCLDYYNRRWYELTGLDYCPGGDLNWQPVIHPDDVEGCRDAWDASIRAGTIYKAQFRLWDRRLQEYRWYLGHASPLRDSKGVLIRWIGTCVDVHDQKTAEDRLEQEVRNRTEELETMLLEKETLLKEIHHRVKNNLQVISSLLRMQSESLKDVGAAAALMESQRRVLSMALIHERLYSSHKMDEIDFGEYTQTLVDELFASCASGKVTSRVDTSRVLLNIDQAIPCGLILNELVTNALKYAYPSGVNGEVCIELRETDAERIQLTVADQGVGLPEDWHNSDSLGLPIVEILARQLGGILKVRSQPGAAFSVEFPFHNRKAAKGASAAS